MRSLPVLLALLVASPSRAQIETAGALLDSLRAVAAIGDDAERDVALDALWDDLVAAGRVPFAAGGDAVFLWRGAAGTASVAGDHTGWSPRPAERIGSVWARVEAFDPAGRIDYKWVVDGSWLVDPANPHQQWGGFGPNSELRMPEWVFPDETVQRPGLPSGTLSGPRTVASAHYEHPVTYRVWTPAVTGADHPTVYVTDGHEYADDRLGALPTVLDNLVAEGRIEPPVVVFIDPRVGGQNRRSDQYVQNPGFAAFVATELVPAVDAAYPTRAEREARVILGTSLGGLFSAYLGTEHPDVFGRLAIQSPAFWVSETAAWSGPSIYERVAAAPDGLTVAMTTGTVNDTEEGARRMRDVLAARGGALTYLEVPEGHSWGNWRATLDVLLEALLPPRPVARGNRPTDGSLRLVAFPNPTAGVLTLRAEGTAGPVQLACSDALGRTVWRGAGPEAIVPAGRMAAGVYRCVAQAGLERAVRVGTVLH